jgi:hypothetical protein
MAVTTCSESIPSYQDNLWLILSSPNKLFPAPKYLLQETQKTRISPNPTYPQQFHPYQPKQALNIETINITTDSTINTTLTTKSNTIEAPKSTPDIEQTPQFQSTNNIIDSTSSSNTICIQSVTLGFEKDYYTTFCIQSS